MAEKNTSTTKPQTADAKPSKTAEQLTAAKKAETIETPEYHAPFSSGFGREEHESN